MRQFQQSLIELEAEAERLLLARDEVSFKILEVWQLGLQDYFCFLLSIYVLYGKKLGLRFHNLFVIEMKLFRKFEK